MLEKTLMETNISVFAGVTASIVIIFLLWVFYKEYKKKDKKFNSYIIYASLAGIFFSIFLLFTSYIVYNKINEYNESKLEISIDEDIYQQERSIFKNELKDYQSKLIEYKKQNSEIKKPVKPVAPEKPQAPDYIGTFGDLIGGSFAPAIGLLAALTGGLAFFAQYKANQDIKNQFKLQQFESQFYEMLALHKDNINEMKIEGYEFDDKGNKHKKDTTGRKIFVSMNTELLCIHQIVKKIILKNSTNKNVFKHYKDEIFNLSYSIFFHGIPKSKNEFLKKKNNRIKLSFLGNNEKARKKILNKIFEELETIKILHYNNGLEGNVKNRKFKNRKYLNYLINIPSNIVSSKDLNLIFNYKPFDGHQSRLGHYYRHLFSMVNHVVKQKDISYEERRDYLKILRSQFSIYELTLLFYNYFSGYGIGWENKYGTKENEINNNGNSFFLDYRFLHNIEDDYRFNDIKPSEILLNNVKIHQNKIACKKGFNSDNDPVFELY